MLTRRRRESMPTSVRYGNVRAQSIDRRIIKEYTQTQFSYINSLLVGPDVAKHGREGNSMALNWRGVFPAVTTHFSADYSVDTAGTLRHLDVMIVAGVHGLVLLGTVGEICSLEYDEKLELVRGAVAHVAGRVPVLAGVAEYTTSEACRFAEAAEATGVDGLMVLPAMVYKSDARETIAHFRAVASVGESPILCYNNPVSYGVDITPQMFAELAD